MRDPAALPRPQGALQEGDPADDEVAVDFAEVTTARDRVAIVATMPLTRDDTWTAGVPGNLWVFDRGALQATLPSA